jgi:hypothetical protein
MVNWDKYNTVVRWLIFAILIVNAFLFWRLGGFFWRFGESATSYNVVALVWGIAFFFNAALAVAFLVGFFINLRRNSW